MQDSLAPLLNSDIVFQHSHLHDRMDAINRAIRHPIRQDEFLELLQDAQDFFVFHFQAEDQLMRKLDYPKHKLDAHRNAHSKALINIRELLLNFSLNKSTPKYIFEFISDWTHEHESTEDRELSLFLKDHLNSGKLH